MILKKHSKNVLVSLLMLFSLTATSVAWPTNTVSAASCNQSGRFLTLPYWYRGLGENDSKGQCVVKVDNVNDIWVIVLNVIDILLQIVGYLAAGFALYGGFRYISSSGSPDGIAKAKDTIVRALIGMVIAMSAAAIVGFIVGNVG